MNTILIQLICFFIAILIATKYLNKEKSKTTKIEIKKNNNIIMKLDDEIIYLILYNNEIANIISDCTPIVAKKIKTTEDRIVFEIDKEIAVSPENVKSIKNGDIVLDENNNIIIFLEDMECNKNYIKIGKILLIDKLDNLKKDDKNTIIFERIK